MSMENKDNLRLPNTAYRPKTGLLAREHENCFDKISMKTTIRFAPLHFFMINSRHVYISRYLCFLPDFLDLMTML